MAKMRELRPVDENYPLVGPNQRTHVQPIDVPARTLFNCLVNAGAWQEWLGVEVEWTSPEPFGVGTTRTVTTAGQTIEEYFFTWTAPAAGSGGDGTDRHQNGTPAEMGFRFDRATLPVDAFAELYQCLPTGPQSCVLRWSYAFEFPGGPVAPLIGKAFGAGFGLKAKRSVGQLAAMLESNPTRFA